MGQGSGRRWARRGFDRSVAWLLVSLMIWSGQLPLIQARLATVQAAQTTPVKPPAKTSESSESKPVEPEQAAADQASGGEVAVGEPSELAAQGDDAIPLTKLRQSAKLLVTATTDRRRIEFNGVDFEQLRLFQERGERLALDPEADLGDLGPEPSVYDRRLIRSILHIVTPTDEGGAGQEFLEIEAITKGHRGDRQTEEEETEPPEGERVKETPHFRDRGAAVDVAAKDYLRGSVFTVETDTGGKETVKEEIKHLPLQPIEVRWQDDAPQGLGTTGAGRPSTKGQTPAGTSDAGLAGFLLDGLLRGFEAAGADVDLAALRSQLGSFDNLGELANQVGQGYLPQALEADPCLAAGRYGLRQTGQCLLEQSVDGQIPAFGFFGETFDQFILNAGREVVTKNLGLAEGALIGETSAEVVGNAGERFWESALGDLPLGTLDGVRAGDRADLERRVGRGRLAKLLGLDVGSIPLGATPSDVQRALGLVWDEVAGNSQLLANQLGVPTVDAVGLLRSNPDELLRLIGADTLARLEVYHPSARDRAFNLEARPTITTLPQGSFPQIIDELLRQYRFRPEDEQLLAQIRAAEAAPSSSNTTTRFREIFPDDTALRAWLLDTAYHATADPNRPQLTDRLLAADPSVFAQTGIEVIAKGMATDNNDRAAVRAYLRDGTLGEGFASRLDLLAGQLGFPSRASFAAVFRDDAPVVGFGHVGRITVAAVYTATPETTSELLGQSRTLPGDLRQRLETAKEELVAARRDPSVREAADQGVAAVDGLLAGLQAEGYPITERVPRSWTEPLRTIHRAGQAAVASSRTGLEGARDLLAAINGLTAQVGGQAYSIDPGQLSVGGLPRRVTKLVGDALSGFQSMTEAVERIGGNRYDVALGLGGESFYPLLVSVNRALARGNVAGARRSMANFAAQQERALGEMTKVLAQATGQFGRAIELAPERLVGAILGGWELASDLGSRVLDAGFGLSRMRPLAELLRTVPFVGPASQAFFDSIGLRQLARVITDLPDLVVDPDEVGGAFQALLYSAVSAKTGWRIGPDGIAVENPRRFIEQVLGKRLTPELAAAIGLLDLSPKGIDRFAKQWRFWENPTLSPRLERIIRASFPDLGGVLPPGVLATLFDPKIDGATRTKKLETLLRGTLERRFLDPFLASALDIPGLPAGALIAAKNILLSDASSEAKSEAWRSLGLVVADSLTREHFGFPVSWLVDDATSTVQKVQIGLRIASQSLGLDPSIGGLVDTAFQTFFIDGGLDTSTKEGRTKLAGLVLAVGNVAGVPAEYATLASAFITGDIEATAIAFAGGQFDRLLRANGIFTVGFADFYEAIAGPSQATLDRFRAEAAAETLARFGSDPDPRVGNRDAFFDQALAGKIGDYQTAAREKLLYAGLDLALAKTLRVPGVGGLVQSFTKGTFEEQAGSVGQLLAGISGSPEAAIILGNVGLAKDLAKFFGSGNIADMRAGSLAALDGWLTYGTKFPIVPGTSKAILEFAKSGDFGKLENVAVGYAQIGGAYLGGVVEQKLGLQPGSIGQLNQAWQGVQAAEAYKRGLQDAFKNNTPITDEQWAMAAERTGVANAQLVSAGVNLVFGKTFAGLDQSLGLPSGTASMLANTAIMAIMVPGIGLGTLLMQTVLPYVGRHIMEALGIGRLLGGLGDFLGLGGGKKTRQVILWSRYVDLWPEEVEYNCKETAPTSESEGVTVTSGLPECEVGKEIALAKALPEGVFSGDTPEAFQLGAREAANTKIEQLVANLLLMDLRLEDPGMAPSQIRSHQREHGFFSEQQLDRIWGNGQPGSYQERIEKERMRKGYFWDEPGQPPAFLGIVHWHY